MNNFAVKNVINNLEKNKEMPYQETNDVSLKANQIIYTSVNNNFQKMVNNDLYIQKQLLNKSNYTEGPRLSSDDEVKNAEDGYKVWNPDISDEHTGNVSVLRKRVRPVQETITKTECSTTPYANFVMNDQNIGTIVGTRYGLYTVDNSYSKAEKVQVTGIGSMRCGVTTNENDTIVGSTTGLWVLSDQISNIHKISEIDDINDIQNISGEIYAARENGVFRLQYHNGVITKVSKIPDVDDESTSLVGINRRLIATTKDAIYDCGKEHTVYQTGLVTWGRRDHEKVVGFIEYNNRTFFYSNFSIYEVTDDDKVKRLLDFNASTTGNTYVSNCHVINGTLFFTIATKDGAIRKNTGVWKYDGLAGCLTRTGITESVYDIISYHGRYFISVSQNRVVWTDDLVKAEIVKNSNIGAQMFVRNRDSVFCSNGTEKLPEIVEKTKQDIVHLKNEPVLAQYRNTTASYVCTTSGIFDGNLRRIYPIVGEVSFEWCRFVEIGNVKLSEIFALTNLGIIRLDGSAEVVSERTDIADVKYTTDYLLVLFSDGKLSYQNDTDVDFWNVVHADLEDLESDVSQVEDVGKDGYFLRDGYLFRCSVDTDIDIENQYGITANVQGIDTTNYCGPGSEYLSNTILNYYDTGHTVAVMADDAGSVSYSELIGFSSDADVKTRLYRRYVDDSLHLSDYSNPLMPMIRDGVFLRDIQELGENVQIDSDGIKSNLITEGSVPAGRPLYTDVFSHPDEIFETMFQYEDNSRGLSYQDDRITFFTSLGADGAHYLKYTYPRKINYAYVESDTLIKDFCPAPFPENLSDTYLLKFVPNGLVYTYGSVGILSSIEDSEGNTIGADIQAIGNSRGYIGQYCDRDWSFCEKTFTSEGDEYTVSCYTKGFYHIFQEELYKTYYTVIVDENRGYLKSAIHYLSSDISERPVTIDENSVRFAEPAVRVSRFTTTLDSISKIRQNGESGYVYFTKKNNIYYQKNTIEKITSSWLKADIQSSFTFDDADVCDGYGFFIKNTTKTLYVMDSVDENIVKAKIQYTKTAGLGITPKRIQSIYLGGKPYLFIYGKSAIQYVAIEDSAVIVRSLELPGFESGATIEHTYEFDDCGDVHLCIIDSNKNIYEISYGEYEFIVEKKTPCVDVDNFNRCFQYEDSQGLYLKPEFDILVDNSTVYVNSFKLDYSDKSLTNVISSDSKIVATVIGSGTTNALYISKGNLLRRKKIHPEDPFVTQIGDFNSWDNYESIWLEGDYEFDSDVKCVLTANVDFATVTRTKIIILTDSNNLYISDFDPISKVDNPEIWSSDFSQMIESSGIVINKVVSIDSGLVLCTNKGLYRIETNSVVRSSQVDNEKCSNIIKLAKLDDTKSNANILCFKIKDRKGILTHDGSKTSDIRALSDINVTNIHQGGNKYYVCGETGVSTLNDVGDDLVQLDGGLSGTEISYTLGNNVYCSGGFVVGLGETTYYEVDGNIDVGVIPEKIYQYNDRQFYIKDRETGHLFSCDKKSVPTTCEVMYKNKAVVQEYDDFSFVKTSDGSCYYDNKELYPTKYLSDTDLYCGKYLCREKLDVNKFETGDTFVPQIVSEYSGVIRVVNIEGNVVVARSDGWYLYEGGSLRKLVTCSFPTGAAPYTSVNSGADRFTGLSRRVYVFVLNGCDLYQFDPVSISFKSMFSTDKGNINAIDGKNVYTYLFGTQSQGLWYTFYGYDMVDDTVAPKTRDMTTEVEGVYELSIAQHIAEYHTNHDSVSSVVDYVNNNMLGTDLRNMASTWSSQTKTPDSFIVVSNDVVQSVKFQSPQNPIKVYVKNDFTGDEFTQISGVSFIYKLWTLGQKELYINIPTTDTYYKPHLSGLSYCKNYNLDITMQNTNLSGRQHISDGSTRVKVEIERKYFDNVRNFSDILIEGQSLPLKIYKDAAYYCEGAEQQFHSVVKRSVFTKKEHDEDHIILFFRCYGTDEQSLKLLGF